MEEKLIKTSCELVSISIESGEEKEFIEFLREKFQRELNGQCQLDNYGNLICKIPAKNSSALQSLALFAHADTVKPGKNVKPVVKKDGIIYFVVEYSAGRGLQSGNSRDSRGCFRLTNTSTIGNCHYSRGRNWVCRC